MRIGTWAALLPLLLTVVGIAGAKDLSPLSFQADDFPPRSPLYITNSARPHPRPPELGGWSNLIEESHRLAGCVVYCKPWMAGHGQWDTVGIRRPGGDRFIDPPSASELLGATSPIRIYGVRGETVPVVLQMYAMDTLRNVQVGIPYLEGYSRIRDDSISIRWLLTSRTGDGQPQPTELVDGWLVAPRAGHAQPAGTMDEYWFLIWIPPTYRPGAYDGTITVSSEARPDTHVDVHLEVLPFQVDSSPYVHGFWHGGNFSLGPERAYELHLRHMTAWGFNGDGVGDSCPPPMERQPDLSDLFDYLQLCGKEDIRSPVWYSYAKHVVKGDIPGVLYQNPQWVREHFAQIEEVLLARPELPDVVICLADETRDLELIDHVVESMAGPIGNMSLARVRTGILVDSQQAFDHAVGYFDVIYQSATCSGYDANFQFGSDVDTSVFDMNPGLSRMGYGIYLWRLAGQGCPGVLDFVYGWNDHEFVSTVNALENKHIHSTAWVSASVGTWDLRYIATLERLIRENPDDHSSIEARAYLDQVYGMVEVSPGEAGRFRQLWHPEAYADFRLNVSAYIMLIQKLDRPAGG